MRNSLSRIALTLFLLAVACPFSTSAAPNQAAQGQFYVCRAIAGLYQEYVSGINPLDANVNDIQVAWQNYVKSTYAIAANDNTAECTTGTESAIEQIRAAFKQQTSVARNGKFVETNWKFVRDQATAASKPGAIYGYCESGTTYAPGPVYLSEIFEVPLEDAMAMNRPIDQTFIPYLKKQYGVTGDYSKWYTSDAACPHFESVTAAQDSKQHMLDQFKKANKRIVETNWKYARNADTPPPQKRGPH